MPNVFISSTSHDLADYRQAAIDTCIKLGLFPIAMEHFEAMGVGATEGSKRKLEDADLYVGIFAHRYGYIESETDGRSVTEIEFDYAGECKLDRLCFLVEPAYPWPPDAVDHENYPRLQQFKNRLSASLIRAQFTTVDNFEKHLIQALVKWKERHHITSSAPADDELQAPVATAPPRPLLLIGREEDLRYLRLRFGIPQQGETESMRDITIVHGWPGVGKTALVTALAYDPAVTGKEGQYPDGVLWAHLGESASPFSELAAWGRALGVPNIAQAPSLEEMMARLRGILQCKRMLLIVDDVWQAEDAAPFRVAGPECTTLITTRLLTIGEQLATRPDDLYRLGVLSDEKGLELLQQLAPTVVKAYPNKCAVLVRDLEGLPLALRVAGRVLESEATKYGMDGVLNLIGDLHTSGKTLEQFAPDDRFDPKTGITPTIDLLLKQSTDYLQRLSPDAYDAYAFLGAFAPKPATFDRDAMKAVWGVNDPMPIIRLLVDLGLLEPLPALGRFWMHSLLVKHAESLLEDD
jgi:hypothetical protein